MDTDFPPHLRDVHQWSTCSWKENCKAQYTVKDTIFPLSEKIALCQGEKPSASSEMTNTIQFIHSEMNSSLLAVSACWTEENGHSSFQSKEMLFERWLIWQSK